ncbi:MAG TPA: Rrf2 family transcriptional regulator, partial [Caldithrix sp.]|nr:Rrf2 family transcriptional regulator [Caldithrix sp.]
SQQLGISFHFLTKILQILTRKNILTSYRGPNGGVGFALPPENISLKDVIVAIDGTAIFEQCILGLNQCSDENPCPLHNEWKKIKTQMEQLFGNTTLASLAENMASGGFRITNLAE